MSPTVKLNCIIITQADAGHNNFGILLSTELIQ